MFKPTLWFGGLITMCDVCAFIALDRLPHGTMQDTVGISVLVGIGVQVAVLAVAFAIAMNPKT